MFRNGEDGSRFIGIKFTYDASNGFVVVYILNLVVKSKLNYMDRCGATSRLQQIGSKMEFIETAIHSETRVQKIC